MFVDTYSGYLLERKRPLAYVCVSQVKGTMSVIPTHTSAHWSCRVAKDAGRLTHAGDRLRDRYWEIRRGEILPFEWLVQLCQALRGATDRAQVLRDHGYPSDLAVDILRVGEARPGRVGGMRQRSASTGERDAFVGTERGRTLARPPGIVNSPIEAGLNREIAALTNRYGKEQSPPRWDRKGIYQSAPLHLAVAVHRDQRLKSSSAMTTMYGVLRGLPGPTPEWMRSFMLRFHKGKYLPDSRTRRAACFLSRSLFAAVGAVSFLFTFIAAPALADYPPESDPRGVDKKIMQPLTDGNVYSVDPKDGQLMITHTDALLPGNGGMDLEVKRVYQTSNRVEGATFEWAELGPGWQIRIAPRLIHENHYWLTSHDSFIYYLDSPLVRLCNPSNGRPSPLILEMPDGSTQRALFQVGATSGSTDLGWKIECKGGEISVTSPTGIVFEFGSIATDRKIGKRSGGPPCHLLRPDDYHPTFSATYMDAKKAIDLSGNWIGYQYIDFGQSIQPWPTPSTYPRTENGAVLPCGSSTDSGNERPSSRISKIDTSDGRSLEFSYDPTSGRLLSIQDNTDRVWRYFHETIPRATQDASYQVLRAVELPTGQTWKYEYKNEITNRKNRKISLVKFPAGGTASFEYQDFYYQEWISSCADADDVGDFATVTQARVKTVRRSDGSNYSYGFTRGRPAMGELDVTTVVGPEGTTTYKFMGASYSMELQTPQCREGGGVFQNNAWQVGRLMERIDAAGNREINVWQRRQIYPDAWYLFDAGYVWDERFWIADLASKTTIRDGLSYVTRYSNYDAYGNVGKIEELDPRGSVRTTTRTYHIDTSKNILNQLKNETVQLQ